MLKNNWNVVQITKINNLKIKQLEVSQIIGKMFEIRTRSSDWFTIKKQKISVINYEGIWEENWVNKSKLFDERTTIISTDY